MWVRAGAVSMVYDPEGPGSVWEPDTPCIPTLLEHSSLAGMLSLWLLTTWCQTWNRVKKWHCCHCPAAPLEAVLCCCLHPMAAEQAGEQ